MINKIQLAAMSRVDIDEESVVIFIYTLMSSKIFLLKALLIFYLKLVSIDLI